MTDHDQRSPVSTTDLGIPAPSDEFSLPAGERGPCSCKIVGRLSDGVDWEAAWLASCRPKGLST